MKIPVNGVAFFDSGIGGLTVMRACRKVLPNEIFYYYGDNRRAPYGNLPQATVRAYTQEVFSLFETLRIKAVVLACNTVTACCVDELRQKYPFPIIGVEPALLTGVRLAKNVLVLGTVATCQSKRFQNLCKKARAQYPLSEIEVVACPNLAKEVEQFISKKEKVVFSFPLPTKRPDIVVLGCTHYIYIKKEIQAFYGCPVCDGNDAVARRLEGVLNRDFSLVRDTQPLLPQTLTTNRAEVHANKQNTNKHSLFVEKGLKIGGKNTYFLGKSRKTNKNIYEQMFVL